MRWKAVDLDTGTLSVGRGRVGLGGEAIEGAPKSRRSRRDLPLPADVTEALRALRPEFYTDEFQRLRTLGPGCAGSSCTACATPA